MDAQRDELKARRTPRRSSAPRWKADDAEPASDVSAPISTRVVATKRTTDLAPLGLAIAALTEAWLGSMTYDDKRRYAATLLARECAGGGFELRAGDGCSLEATAVHRAALRACGVGDSSFVVRRAEAKIRWLGGYDHLRERFQSHGEAGAVLCAMTSLVPPDALSASAADDDPATLLGAVGPSDDPVWPVTCAAVRDRSRLKRTKTSALRRADRDVARASLVDRLGALQRRDGSWDGAIHRTAFALIALEGLGADRSDPRLQRGLDWLERHKTRGRDGIAIVDDPRP